MLTLGDEKVRLRPAEPNDIVIALTWYSDPEVLWNSEGIIEPYDIASVKRMYEYLSKIGEHYIIEVQENGIWLSIGDACLAKETTPIVIGEAVYRGKGIGKSVLRILIERAHSLGWKEMKVKGIYTHNSKSLKLYSSLGFVETGSRFNSHGLKETSMVLML